MQWKKKVKGEKWLGMGGSCFCWWGPHSTITTSGFVSFEECSKTKN